MSSAPPQKPPSRLRSPLRRGALAVLVLGLLVLYAPALWWRPLALVGTPFDDGWTHVSGAIHMHTTYSDGSGPPEQLVAAARRAGLDFIAITDHNNFGAKGSEGYHDGVLTLVGAELSTRTGHIMGLGLEPPGFRMSGDAHDTIDDILHAGGFAVVTHPLRSGESDWQEWEMPGPWALELINGKSLWIGAAFWPRLRALALYPVNANYALLSLAHSPDDVLARWDALLTQRAVVGTAGADAHGRLRLGKKWEGRSLPIGSYENQLGAVRLHVLLDKPLTRDVTTDGPAVLSALRAGRFSIGLDALAPADGFSFTAEADGRRYTMGDTVPAGPTVALHAGGLAPRGARFTLLRDGARVTEGQDGVTLSHALPGVYRVEVRVPGWAMPWVLSNPIYVFDDEAARHRAAVAAWPAEPPAPKVKLAIDSFDGAAQFGPEFDPSSWMDANVLDPAAGLDGHAAARLAFRLGKPDRDRPFVWCALVNRAARDLRGTSGLTFAVRGDGEYRVWVQLRDAAATDKDEGTEWWSASVRTSKEWRRVAVPYARLFSLNAAPGGRLDLDRVRAVVFVIDAAAAEPGARGTIWIDELGAYE